MCFSATVSFVAGASLSAVGAITITKAKRRAEVPFAMIPLLFGIQQLTEGLVWLSFRFNALPLNIISTYTYSLFAYVLWPMYVPFAVRQLETVPWRKKLLSLFQLVGIAVGAYLLYFHIRLPITSQVINKSIVYTAPHFDTFWVIVFYLTATCLAALFSSHKLINLFGGLALLSALLAYWLYSASFVSVWCFFAAILSFIIILYFFVAMKPTRPKGRL